LGLNLLLGILLALHRCLVHGLTILIVKRFAILV
jgi:hypothetical protein